MNGCPRQNPAYRLALILIQLDEINGLGNFRPNFATALRFSARTAIDPEASPDSRVLEIPESRIACRWKASEESGSGHVMPGNSRASNQSGTD